MAGVVGFEPTIHGTKNRCLTTWLHPNSEALSTIVDRRVQDLSDKKRRRFEIFLSVFGQGNYIRAVVSCFSISWSAITGARRVANDVVYC